MRKEIDIHDQIVRGIADGALEMAFGAEWINLERGRSEVLADFIETNREEGINATEYKNRIYASNLQSYADCLLIKA